MEWRAWAVLLCYVDLDLFAAVILKEKDGVGHLAHLGGFGAGALCMLLFRMKQDNEEASNVKAMLDDTKDYGFLSAYELETLLEQQPTDDINWL